MKLAANAETPTDDTAEKLSWLAARKRASKAGAANAPSRGEMRVEEVARANLCTDATQMTSADRSTRMRGEPREREGGGRDQAVTTPAMKRGKENGGGRLRKGAREPSRCDEGSRALGREKKKKVEVERDR